MSRDNYLPNILLKFINCFNLNQEALVEQQTVLQELVFSGEEVPSYFTHQATGSSSSMTIPLSHCFLLHPLFRFKVCTVVGFDSMPTSDVNGVYIHVSCRFKGRFGNIFESFGQPHSFLTNQKDSHLFIMDCRFPLNKDNACYDQVDIQLHASNNRESTFKLKKWGISLFKDYSVAKNGLSDQNILSRVYGICHETELGDEPGDDLVETMRCRKQMRIYGEKHIGDFRYGARSTVRHGSHRTAQDDAQDDAVRRESS
ncbi:hypothetical protein Bca101_048874 [Brassica carinata]